MQRRKFMRLASIAGIGNMVSPVTSLQQMMTNSFTKADFGEDINDPNDLLKRLKIVTTTFL